MKYCVLFALALPLAAAGAPILTADPYPANAAQPDTVSFTIDGGAPLRCSLLDTPAGKVPICDLASITTPGTYTLVMTVASHGACTSAPDSGTCSGGGSASSAPFSYTVAGAPPPPPVVAVVP